jgi:hypothetical protein
MSLGAGEPRPDADGLRWQARVVELVETYILPV